ncbi:MAG: hypothetical protein KatS3mg069_2796 [Meiothermus sp.]|nr:MAG: hypothetical protein KatS3mg069_2796 [Meiothermus sp.]
MTSLWVLVALLWAAWQGEGEGVRLPLPRILRMGVPGVENPPVRGVM